MLPFSRQALTRSSSSLIALRGSQQACARVGGAQRRWISIEELDRVRDGMYMLPSLAELRMVC